MREEESIIRISVRDLVEFLLRSGSLDIGAGRVSESAMLEGARIHRSLQKKEGEGYRAEVLLRMDIPLSVFGRDLTAGGEEGLPDMPEAADRIGDGDEETGRVLLRLEGRADGVYAAAPARAEPSDCPGTENDRLWTIDEIKTLLRGLHSMEAPREVHLAQARCYAWMLARQKGLDRIGIRMTYCSQVTGEVRRFYETLAFSALDSWFSDLIRRYRPWILLRLSFARMRQETLRALAFPFPYRKGQFDLAAGVYRTIVHGKKLFLQAPTGTGKTMAVLFPALKAVGEKKADRVFYLTAKAVTGLAAVEAVGILREKGLRIRALTLASRERVCPCERVDCRPEVCPRAEGHFDRVNDALWSLLQGAADGRPMTLQEIAACADRHRVCPYELSMDAADFADVIICDYNYVFHPRARLTGFFGERQRTAADAQAQSDAGARPNGAVLLIDEAHNLLERGRELYSANLSLQEVRRFRKSVRAVWPGLWKKLRGLVRALGSLREETEPSVRLLSSWTQSPADPSRAALLGAVGEVHNAVQWILEQENRSTALYGAQGGKTDVLQELLEFYFSLLHFEDMLRDMDGHYIAYTAGEGGRSISVHLYCADPAGRLQACMGGTAGAVFFSATFLPIQYYKKLLGGTDRDFEMYARSSFSPDRQHVVIVRDVTSRYRARNEENYARIARTIAAVITCRPGNYMAFFPSYAFLEKVEAAFCGSCGPAPDPRTGLPEDPGRGSPEKLRQGIYERGPDPQTRPPVTVLSQRRDMDDTERAAFLEAFDSPRSDRCLVGFCVLGGMFGEGIDLRSDRLIGSLIVGTGIPPADTRRDLLRDYFAGLGMNGYDYAYRFPGMNKVLQAAGRVIRTAQDTGIITLLDDRFGEAVNRELFPVEWGVPAAMDSARAADSVRDFWDSHPPET